LLILRFLGFARIARDEFSDIVAGMEIFDDRMKLVFSDGSEMTVMYPVEAKYSFHWQRKDGIVRIDTAPHHHGVKTFPNHIHFGSEKDVREDTTTDPGVPPEENFKRVLMFCRDYLSKF
jgi:hypothetical protein